MTDGQKPNAFNITAKEFGRRFRKALSIPFLLNQVCSNSVAEFVTSYSAALGCTEKSFFFPLLTCAAASMGTECCIELTHLWKEPPILWTLIMTPKSLLRMDVAEHLKQEILKVQQEMWTLNRDEDSKECLRKFLFDMISLDHLQDMLKLSNGHGLGIYNSARALHKCFMKPEDIEVMQRLQSGFGWFSDSRVTRNTLSKTRMNVTIVTTPAEVQQTLTTAPNFQELFYQNFLTVCAEENHTKFGQISVIPETEVLREIFLSLMKLHTTGPIVYKLSAEAAEKFGQIHDELTDKAKQMVRKNVENKIFQPALTFLGRLSCVLHVLDNVIDSIKFKVPISRLTWSTEINATTVWHARELLGHIVEQRHALMEPTFYAVQKTQSTPSIDLVNNNEVGAQTTPQRIIQSPLNTSPMLNTSVHSVRRNILNNRTNSTSRDSFDSLLNQNNVTTSVPNNNSLSISNSRTHSQVRSVQNSSGEVNIPSTLSVSVTDDGESTQPTLLSRSPYTSILELSNKDFLETHSSSMRKVLTHLVSQISPSRCVQLKLTPDTTSSDETQKYTHSFARSFLKKLEKMGFGVCEGSKNGNLRHFIFKKKKFSQLSDQQLRWLSELKINQKEFNKCFISVHKKSIQNGNVVCLE